jgi:predicted TIM-barrel fold metal-dependent hydrolase|tara:strand:+ start:5622 stop:6779 length:1158 start_codon:yes stop_codon:yes gene_type:complete
MPYIENRIVHDADAHTMELPNWFDDYADKNIQKAFRERFSGNKGLAQTYFENIDEDHQTSTYQEKNEEELMIRKNYDALGSFNSKDRSEALDLLGVQSQLVFPTSPNVWLESLEHGDDIDMLYSVAEATNRAQIDFCSDDKRLLPVTYIPLANIDRSIEIAKLAIQSGSSALLIPWACPKNHSTSHIGFEPVWSMAEESGIPILFHVGSADFVLPKAHSLNGMPKVKDFHGGEENFRSISYMAISSGPMQALSLLILDGVLERHPNLKFGVIELGSVWVPGFMKQLDSAFEAFSRHEERLQSLSLKPSEYINRQVRVTPYPTEPTGWVIKEAGSDIFMFSSDYPHVEGGRNPLARFEKSIEGISHEAQDKFFRLNFENLMGSGLK